MRDQSREPLPPPRLQRIVGIVVLALGSLLLWPILFDEGPAQLDRSTEIPPAPKVDNFEVAQPTPAATKPVQPQPVDEDEPADDVPAKPDAKVTDSPALTPQGLPQTWVVQVGSFSSQANADALKAKLREKGYAAFTKGNPADKSAAVRVFVGPKLSRERADQIKLELQKNFDLKPFVTPMGN
jgi:DedD protein